MEIWKYIKGWEGLYEVSNLGNVRNKINGKLIIGDINNAGYCRVGLNNKNHEPKKQRFFRHRLVAEHFIDNPNNLEEVNHIDGDKSNNSIYNLEWCDRADNERHKRRNGNEDYYKPFRVEFKNGSIIDYEFKPQLAKELNVTKTVIRYWIDGKSLGYKNYGIDKIYYV